MKNICKNKIKQKQKQKFTTANIIFNGEKFEAFILRSGNDVLCHHYVSKAFQHELEVLLNAIRQEKKRKGIQIGRKEIEFFFSQKT
jgi:hypothetical protein